MTRKKLLEQVSNIARFRHLSLRTEEAYRNWIKRFIIFHGKIALQISVHLIVVEQRVVDIEKEDQLLFITQLESSPDDVPINRQPCETIGLSRIRAPRRPSQ